MVTSLKYEKCSYTLYKHNAHHITECHIGLFICRLSGAIDADCLKSCNIGKLSEALYSRCTYWMAVLTAFVDKHRLSTTLQLCTS
jgi:hypothetical protein